MGFNDRNNCKPINFLKGRISSDTLHSCTVLKRLYFSARAILNFQHVASLSLTKAWRKNISLYALCPVLVSP